MTRVVVNGTGGFPDLFAGNPDHAMSPATIPKLGPSYVPLPMSADVVADVTVVREASHVSTAAGSI